MRRISDRQGRRSAVMKTVAAAIEFGTSKIVTLIAESGSFTRCEIVGSGTVPYAGFADGEWNDREGLFDAISDAIHAAETEARRRIQTIYVGVPSEYIHVTCAVGEAQVASVDGRVTEDEIVKVMDDAADQLDLGESGGNILHRSPAWFCVDEGRHTMSPIGEKKKKLRALVSFIQADPGFIDDIRQCMSEMGIEIGAFLSPTLGMSILLMSFDERDKTPVLVDVGYLNTELSVVEGDAVTFHAVLPIGGGDITAALAEALEINMEDAETIKRDYVFTADDYDAQADHEVTLSDGSVVAFPHSYVAQTIETVTEEIASDIDQTISYAEEYISPRSQVFVTGGGLVNMRGSKEYLAEKLKRSVRVPVVKAARLNNPRFSSALGLMDLVFDAVEQQAAIRGEDARGSRRSLKDLFKKQPADDA